MVADRESPVVLVRVRAGEGVASDPIDVSDRVVSLVFEEGEEKADKLRLVLDNRDLSEFDRVAWRKGNLLEVTWGYAGGLTPAREVVVKKVRGFEQLTVECYARSYLMNSVARSRTWENVRRSDVASEVAGEHGFGADRRLVEDTEDVLPTITQARETDAQLLARLARREGFEFYVDVDGLHFHSRSATQAPARTLVYHDDPGIGEILRVSMENDLVVQPARRTVKGRDPISKEDFVVEVDADEVGTSLAPIIEATQEVFTYGLRGVAAGVTAPFVGKMDVGPTPELTRSAAERRTRGEVLRQRQLTVELGITIIGDPSMLAKTVLRVLGISELLSGNYYVETVRHEVRGGTFTQRLKVIRDGTSEERDPARLFENAGGGGGARQSCEQRVVAIIQAINDLAGAYRAESLGGGPILGNEEIALARLRHSGDSLNRDPSDPARDDLRRTVQDASFGEAAARRADRPQAARRLAAIRKSAERALARCAKRDTAPKVNDAEQPADQGDEGGLHPVTVVDPDTGDTRTVYRDSRGRVVDVGGFDRGGARRSF